jgi:SAM-dependent methyltransferase
MTNNIYDDLKKLGLISDDTIELFAKKTRDSSSLNVWRDKYSGIIFIKDFYVGDLAYLAEDGEVHASNLIKRSSFEDSKDCVRRASEFKALYYNKDVCELGFGNGQFMDAAQPYCNSICGIELNAKEIDISKRKGFSVARDLTEFDQFKFDTIFLFHVFEHFPDPLKKLEQIRKSLKPGGKIVIEVPHAGDLLLRDGLGSHSFKSHSLWSQHLILHTRQSLKSMLQEAGFGNIVIRGEQRYTLSNHMNWLSEGKPSGHTSNFSALDNAPLTEAYKLSLSAVDANDTLIAVASAG